MPIRRLTHLGICVSDLERSLRFYRDALGCREVGRLEMGGAATDTLLGLEGSQLRAVYLERDGWRIELLAFPQPGSVGPAEPRPMNQLGPTHLSFRVDDLDAACARIEAEGGGVLAATRMGAASAGAVMAHDPDGTRLELVAGPGDPDAVPGSAGYGGGG